MANSAKGPSTSGFLNHGTLITPEDRRSGMNSGSLFGVDCRDSGRGKCDHETTNSPDGLNAGFQRPRRHESYCSYGVVGQTNNTSLPISDGAGIVTVGEELGSGRLSSIPSEQLVGGGPVQNEKKGKGAHSTEEQQSSIKAGSSRGSGDSMLGLKLGKRTYFEASAGVAAPTVSSVVPAKKPRATIPGGRCQVDGCKTDLTLAKDYHRRHKVCAMHSKAGRVTVAAQEQRFCQQCSRFHGLAEFDEGKRSCRRRLAGHNERRRKPQLDALALHSRMQSSFHDSRRVGNTFVDGSSFLHHPRHSGIPSLWDEPRDFSYNHGKGGWPRVLKLEDQSSLECSSQGVGLERQLYLAGLSQHSNDRSLFSLLHSPKGMMPVSNNVANQRMHHYLQESVGHHKLALSTSSGAGVLSGLEVVSVSQGLTRVSDSGCALSLQSTTQMWPTRAPVAASLDISATQSDIMSDQFLHDNQTIIAHPVVPRAQQQQQFEWMKPLSIASNAQSISSETGYLGSGSNSMEKDQHGGTAFMHGLNGLGNYEYQPTFSMLEGQVPGQDVKPTIDLMRILSTSQCQRAQPQVSSRPFQSESNHFEDLQVLKTTESSIFFEQTM